MTTAPSTWRDNRGRHGAEHSEVRLLRDVTGLASVWADQPDEEVLVPAGTLATVLYVNEDERLVGVDFGDGVEGNVFGNVSWDDVEIVRFHFAQSNDVAN